MLAPAIYGLLTLVPLVLGTIAAVQHFSAAKRACSRCRMRGYCKGCAAPAP